MTASMNPDPAPRNPNRTAVGAKLARTRPPTPRKGAMAMTALRVRGSDRPLSGCRPYQAHAAPPAMAPTSQVPQKIRSADRSASRESPPARRAAYTIPASGTAVKTRSPHVYRSPGPCLAPLTMDSFSSIERVEEVECRVGRARQTLHEVAGRVLDPLSEQRVPDELADLAPDGSCEDGTDTARD